MEQYKIFTINFLIVIVFFFLFPLVYRLVHLQSIFLLPKVCRRTCIKSLCLPGSMVQMRLCKRKIQPLMGTWCFYVRASAVVCVFWWKNCMVVICDIKLSIIIKQYLGESNLYVVLCRFLYAGMTVNLNKYLVAEICSWSQV